MKLKYKRLLTFILLTILAFTFLGNSSSDVSAAHLPGGKNYINPDVVQEVPVSSYYKFETGTIALKPNTNYVFWMPYDVNGNTSANLFFYGNNGNVFAEDEGFNGMDDGSGVGISNDVWYHSFNSGSSTEVQITIEYNNTMNFDSSFTNVQLEEALDPTPWVAYETPDIDPPLINGATAVHIINYDVPTTVNSFKATLTATDNIDGDLTSSITVSRDLYSGNEAVLGDKEVDYSVSDTSGNSTTVTVIFRTVDVTNPIINLLGGSVIHIEYGNSWSDPGYTATDNYDSSVTVNTSGTVNASILGNYVLNYNATDSSGNAATQKTRTVIIEDTTAPVQTLQGGTTVYVEFGDNFTDPGATWTDTYDGSGNSVVTGSVNVGVLGSYTLRYNKTDSEGNSATELTRTVIVRDTTSPTFTGETSYTFNTGAAPTLALILEDIAANDLYDGLITSSIVTTTDNYSANRENKGTYTVVLTVDDSQGNSETMTLTIELIDNEPPVFSTSENLYTVEYANTLTQEQLKDILGVS